MSNVHQDHGRLILTDEPDRPIALTAVAGCAVARLELTPARALSLAAELIEAARKRCKPAPGGSYLDSGELLCW